MTKPTNIYADDVLQNALGNVKIAANSDAVHTMLDKYGLNWTVSKQPLSLPDGSLTGFYGIMRDDNKDVFSTCKDAYKPFQNTELAEMLIRLSEKTGYAIHNGGDFNGGAKVYLQLESPNKIEGIGNNSDSVNGFLTGINSHDGTTSLKWGETNITISCQNTFFAALRAIKNSARHTSSLNNKVEVAIAEITGIVEAERSLFDTFIKLADIQVKKENIVKIVRGITKVDTSLSAAEMNEKFSSYAVNRSGELLAAISTEMAEKGETLWGLLSGVTQYTTHVLPAPKRKNGKLESIYTGSAFDINNRSFAEITGMAGIK